MATPLTPEEIKGFLAELGYAIPDTLLAPILCVVNKIIP